VIGFLVYPKIFQKDKFKDFRTEDGRISIAVMPFKNLTGDTLYNVWQEGLQNLLISTLTNSKELSVRQYFTMLTAMENNIENKASLTPSSARDLARKLKTKTIILGNILRANNTIRISTQLMDVESEKIFKTYHLDAETEGDLLKVADSLSKTIKEYFEIKQLMDEFGYNEISNYILPTSVEALRYYVLGLSAFLELNYPRAIYWLKKSIELDSTFAASYIQLSSAYSNLGLYLNDTVLLNQAEKMFTIAYQHKDSYGIFEQLRLESLRCNFYETPREALIYSQQLLDLDDQSLRNWYNLGHNYYKLHEYDKVIYPIERVFEIADKINFKRHWAPVYILIGDAYHNLGEHEKEKEIYERGLEFLPENPWLIQQQAICALSHRDFERAQGLISMFRNIMIEKNRWELSDVLTYVGDFYFLADLPDSAVVYYKKGLDLEPGDPFLMYLLGSTLIDEDIDLDKGMDFIDQILKKDPNNYLYIAAKGWGLYKLGQYEEAYKLLNKAWEKRRYYDHDIYLHLQEARKKVKL
jgi:tetratricopeptide (TPR) repeat protein